MASQYASLQSAWDKVLSLFMSSFKYTAKEYVNLFLIENNQ